MNTTYKCPKEGEPFIKAIASGPNSREIETSLMAIIHELKAGRERILSARPNSIEKDMPNFYFTQGQVNMLNETEETMTNLIAAERERQKENENGRTK